MNALNRGKRWTCEEDDKLEKLFRSGIKSKDIASQFQRTPLSIHCRIQHVALQKVISKEMSLTQASDSFNIDYQCLRNKYESLTLKTSVSTTKVKPETHTVPVAVSCNCKTEIAGLHLKIDNLEKLIKDLSLLIVNKHAHSNQPVTVHVATITDADLDASCTDVLANTVVLRNSNFDIDNNSRTDHHSDATPDISPSIGYEVTPITNHVDDDLETTYEIGSLSSSSAQSTAGDMTDDDHSVISFDEDTFTRF
jgi:hypothetical protein